MYSFIGLKEKIRISNAIQRAVCIFVSDEKHARRTFLKRKNKQINLENPQTFTEKLQYLKLHYRNPLMQICADKYYAREYVALCGYSGILKKIYGVYNDVSDIDEKVLPDKYFARWNHMSGGNFIVQKSNHDNSIFELLKVYKNVNWYNQGREWQYKGIIPKLLCEEFLHNSDGSPLVDYKLYCFSGKVKYYMISFGEYEHEHINHKFDVNGNSIDSLFKKQPTIAAEDVKIPETMPEMIKIAENLSKPFPHVRVDFYDIDGRIVFGEMTFFSDSGFVNVYSEEMDKEIGSWIDLDKYKNDMANPRNQ